MLQIKQAPAVYSNYKKRYQKKSREIFKVFYNFSRQKDCRKRLDCKKNNKNGAAERQIKMARKQK